MCIRDSDHILRVVDKFLIELELLLHEKHVTLSATPAAREWLGQNGFDPLMGARPMARLIQDKVKRALADELLFGKLVDGGRVTLDAVEGEPVSYTHLDVYKRQAIHRAVAER